jgi:hypothetical protein
MRRMGDDAVMLEHGAVQSVDLGLVQVGHDDSFLEVVDDDIADGAAEITIGFLVELGPDLLAGLPNHAPEAPPRVPQGHDEQPGAAVAVDLGVAGQRAFAVIDLGFLASGELETVELFRVDVTQSTNETLDALITGGERELIDQILVDGLGVTLEANLLFDPFAIQFAR